MPEMQPSCIKPTDNISGPRPASESGRAKAYERLRPGVQIPEAQKAERYDLMKYRTDNGIVNRRRRAGTSSVLVPDSSAWCECGKLGHDGDCQ